MDPGISKRRFRVASRDPPPVACGRSAEVLLFVVVVVLLLLLLPLVVVVDDDDDIAGVLPAGPDKLKVNKSISYFSRRGGARDAGAAYTEWRAGKGWV